jgi:type I restriction enzyme M protein
VECVRPTAADTVADPACGTGGFLLAARDYVLRHQGRDLDRDQKRHLRTAFVKGWELVPNTARLCIMNLYLHGIDADLCPVRSGVDSLTSDPNERFSVVLTNPPFGKKSTIAVVNEAGELEKDDAVYERQDFWTTTKNKQLNFLQHVRTLLRVNGRCAIVVPDNVLFEGGAGETVRRNLLRQCDVHTLLRLPTGIFYAQGVKANVLFFDAKPAQEKPWTQRLWVYDLRTNQHFTLKNNPLKRSDLDEFVACYHPANRHRRQPTWGESNAGGRWRSFEYEELLKRDKVNLDLFWLKDESLEGSDELPPPDVLAQEIADDLQAALEQFAAIAEKLKG